MLIHVIAVVVDLGIQIFICPSNAQRGGAKLTPAGSPHQATK